MSHLGSLNLAAQGKNKRVLFVCSGGMLRSATASHVFCQEPYNWNTRAAGTMEGAIVPVTETLLEWADEIYCMMPEHALSIKEKFEGFCFNKVRVLAIEDAYNYRAPRLVHLLLRNMERMTKKESDGHTASN
jgi:predicted protein tyrosine phosphatase